MYEGQFENGMMHGKGELRYKLKGGGMAVIRGRWKEDVVVERTLFFAHDLEYKEEGWNYCKLPDRRCYAVFLFNSFTASVLDMRVSLKPTFFLFLVSLLFIDSTMLAGRHLVPARDLPLTPRVSQRRESGSEVVKSLKLFHVS